MVITDRWHIPSNFSNLQWNFKISITAFQQMFTDWVEAWRTFHIILMYNTSSICICVYCMCIDLNSMGSCKERPLITCKGDSPVTPSSVYSADLFGPKCDHVQTLMFTNSIVSMFGIVEPLSSQRNNMLYHACFACLKCNIL